MALFTTQSPNTVAVEHQKVDKPASCFVAGTKIATASGPVAIEELYEGTRILTEATSSRFGIASDEQVFTHLSQSILVGFSRIPLPFYLLFMTNRK